MLTRLQLQAKLEAILGSRHVYYQPPESLKLEYPAIKYIRAKMDAKYADDEKYSHLTRYQVTTLDTNPDSTWQNAIFNLPYCSHVRQFVVDGLYHDIFDLYV